VRTKSGQKIKRPDDSGRFMKGVVFDDIRQKRKTVTATKAIE